MKVDGGALYYEALLNNTQFNKQVKELEDRMNSLSVNAVNNTSKIDESFNRLAGTLAGVFSIAAAQNFVMQLINVRGEFQQIEIAFTTMLKSKEKADQLMKEAVELAAITPFGLNDVANGAKQLLAYGTEANKITGELTMLGNIASGVGAPLNDIVYLYGTLQTQGRAYSKDIQQFTGRGIPIIAELARQFNVTESEVMGLVEAGKVGFPEIQKAFGEMTSSSGMFYNLMQEQSKSLTGQISNLEDSWDSMLNTMGKQNEGLLAGGIEVAAELVENYDKVLNILGILIATYGSYKAALIATATLEKFQASRQVVETITKFNGARMVSVQVTRQLTVAEGLNAAGKGVLIKAQTAYNAVLAASPLVAVTALVTALGLAIYSLTQITNAADEAQQRFNSIQDEGVKAADSEKNKINELISVIQSQTASVEQKKAAYDKLQSTTNGVLSAYSQEEIATGKATQTIEQYISKIREATAARKAFSEFQELADKMDELNRNGIKAVGTFDRVALSMKNTFSSVDGRTWGEYFDELWSKEASDDRIVSQMKDKVGFQMDEIKKMYGDKFSEIITGVTSKDVPVQTVRNVDFLDKEIQNLKEKQKQAATSKEYAQIQKDINKLEAEKTAITGKLNKSEQKQSDERLKALEAIAKAEQEAFRKGLSKDEEEIKAAKDKYEDLRKEAKKAGLGSGAITRIDRIEEKVTGDLRYNQETDKLRTELDKQKTIYSEYESYKEQLGKEAADKRFENEKAAFDNYGEYLKSKMSEFNGMDVSAMTGSQRERYESLKKQSEEFALSEKQKQDQRFIEAIKASETFEQKKAEIENRYQKQREQLLKNTDAYDYEARAKVLEESEQKEINDLKDANAQKLKVFQDLYEGIEELSDRNARKVIEDARAMLNELIKAGKISPELAKDIQKSLRGAEKSINDRLPQRLGKLGAELRNIAGEVSSIDEAFGNVLNTVSNVISGAANIKTSLDAIKEAQKSGDILGGIAGGLGVAGSAFGIVNSLVSMFDKSDEKRKSAEAERQYSQDLQIKAIEAQSKAMERQLALIKDIYGAERLKQYGDSVEELNKRIIDSANSVQGKLILTGNQFEDELIKRINGGENIDSILKGFNPIKNANELKKAIDLRDKIISGGVGKVNISSPQTLSENYKEIERLQLLLDRGNLDEKTAAEIQNLIKYAEQYRETLKAIKAETTGIGFDEITNSIVDLFAQGGVAAEDFGKNFDEMMKKSILSSFKRNALEKQLEGFYDDFADYAESNGGLNENEIIKLRTLYDGIISNSQKQFEELQKATGMDFSSTSNTGSNLKGAIQRELTEQTASELAGLYRAQYDLAKMQYQETLTQRGLDIDRNSILTQMILHLFGIEQHTFRTANNTDTLNNKLDQIITNTKPSQSGRGMGI